MSEQKAQGRRGPSVEAAPATRETLEAATNLFAPRRYSEARLRDIFRHLDLNGARSSTSTPDAPISGSREQRSNASAQARTGTR